jgi:dTDP-4-amino-4,6-dideoxygalactose transaminase
MKVPLLDLRAQYAAIRDEVREEVMRILDEQDFVLGPRVKAAEEELAAYCGCAHGVGVASGTDALLVGLKAMGLGRGDEVITTPYTFFATAGAIWNTGARPVFVDIEPESFNLDPDALDAAVTERTRAIVPVHLFGQCADMDRIGAFARERDLLILEDAAQSVSACWRDAHPGALGFPAAVSFYPSKNLGGFGDGGMILTDDEAVADRARKLRVHGGAKRYMHEEVGTNSRLDVLQAAAVRIKLKRLDEWTEARRAHARRYDSAFANLEPVATPPVEARAHHCYNQYVIRARDRDALQQHLREAGVGTAIYYPRSLHLQACFAELGHAEGDFPVSEQASRETLSIPVYPELTDEQQEHVIASVLSFYGAS